MAGNKELSMVSGISVPLVGRQEELAGLDRVLGQVLQYETPQSVMLVGSQGLGKTRLVSHWIQQLGQKHPGVRVLMEGASAEEPAYAPVTRLLKKRFGLREAEGALESFRSQVEEVLEDRRVTEVLHFLGAFLGIAVQDNPFLRALEEAPAGQHDQIARTVLRRFIEADAARYPLVLVLDDLQRADDATVSLFSELAEGLEGAPVVLVGCCRPELFTRRPELASLEAEHTRMDISRLSEQESEQQLRRLLAGASEVPEALVEAAVDRCGGNPLLLEQLLHVLLDRGLLTVQDGRATVDEQQLAGVDLPMSMEEAVEARVAVLTPPQRDLLEKASVLGAVFWQEALVSFSRLQQEVERPADLWMADVLNETIRELLDELVERDYLLRLPDSTIPGTTELAFKQNPERERLYALVPEPRRQRYHVFAAQWLESRLSERSEAQLEDLARHYHKGGNRRRAAFCFVHAGDRARARYANAQAAAYYRQGLELLEVDDALSKIDALHNLGDVCTVLGHNDEALEHFSQMLRHAWLLDHRGKGGAAHRRLGRLQSTLGAYARAIGHLNTALRLFDLARDKRGVAATLDDVGKVSWLRGDYDQALEFHRRALELKREIGQPRSIAVSLNNIGQVHQDSGTFSAALDCFVEALEIRKEVGDQLGVVDSLMHLGEVYRAQSDYSKAIELWTEARALAQDVGDRLDEAYLRINLGETELQLGKPGDAEAHVKEAMVLARDLGDRRLLTDCSLTLSEVRLAMGDLTSAESEARQALELSRSLGLKPQTGAAYRALAEVAASRELTDDNREQAFSLFRRAIEVFTELGNDLALARTFAGFADYQDRCGQWEDADHYRSSADEIFNRLK
jgi:tetratricopeptide (TPR) repeat protein